VTYVRNISAEPPPDIDTPFIFYYADLGLINIMISKDGNIIIRIIN
jgi:hypothetical protein